MSKDIMNYKSAERCLWLYWPKELCGNVRVKSEHSPGFIFKTEAFGGAAVAYVFCSRLSSNLLLFGICRLWSCLRSPRIHSRIIVYL